MAYQFNIRDPEVYYSASKFEIVQVLSFKDNKEIILDLKAHDLAKLHV